MWFLRRNAGSVTEDSLHMGVGMGRIIGLLCVLLLIGGGLFWFITQPKRVNPNELIALQGDAERGRVVFHAGGCASCHAAPKAEGEARYVLAGGKAFETDFGTFYAPNISPHQNGIGGWSAEDLINAVKFGTSPGGAHYYPAFPYVSYGQVSVPDIVDLKAYLDTLEPVATQNLPHDVGFPFNIRLSLGGWKFLYGSRDWQLETSDPVLERGRYLVEALGHCTECHTSRNPLGGTRHDRWLAGAPNPSGKGRIPNITPHETGIAKWSSAEIVEYLTSGFTPDFDVAGGEMYEVVLNMAELSDTDRAAIAAYLKAIPALASE